MKKGIIVLLITVLVAGMAFADSSLSGYVSTSFKAGLDKDSFIGFGNYNTVSFYLGIMEPLAASLTGEGKVYVDAAASASFFMKASYVGADTTTYDPYGKLSISKVNITNGSWFIGLMGVKGFATYAANALDFDSDGYGVVLNNSAARKAPAGINFGYKNFVGSFGFVKSVGKQTLDSKIYASLEAKDVEVMEGLKLSAYVAYNNYVIIGSSQDLADLIAASAKVDYASDKLSVLVAGDTVFYRKNSVEGQGVKKGNKFDVSAQAQLAVSYDPVSVDAYYVHGALSTATLSGYNSYDAINYKGGNLNGRMAAAKAGDYHYIHANVDVALDSVAPYVGMFANIKSSEDYALKPYVGVSVPVDSFTLGAEGYFLYDKVANVSSNPNAFGGSLSVSYAFDFGTLSAGCSLDFAQGAEKYAISSVAPYAQFASTTLVNGATLKLVWSGAEFIGEKTKSNGAITLSATVVF